MAWHRRATAAALIALSACISSDVPPPQPSPALSTPAVQVTTALPSPSLPLPSQTGSIGARLTLLRSSSDAVDVNALEVVDPATGTEPPPAGSRYIAVRLEVSNPGGASYRERALDGAILIDSLGVAHAALREEPVRGGFGADVTIRRGGFHRGFVAFAVSQGIRPVAFRFTPAGPDPETGEWRSR